MDNQSAAWASLSFDMDDPPHVGFVDPLATDANAAQGRHFLAPFDSRYKALSLQYSFFHRCPTFRAVHLKRQTALQNINPDHRIDPSFEAGVYTNGQILPIIAVVASQCLYRAQPDNCGRQELNALGTN